MLPTTYYPPIDELTHSHLTLRLPCSLPYTIYLQMALFCRNFCRQMDVIPECICLSGMILFIERLFEILLLICLSKVKYNQYYKFIFSLQLKVFNQTTKFSI